MFSLLTTLYILAKGPVRCNGKKIWHTLTFYSSLPGLSLHVLRCNNIINYQTALGVFVSGTTVRMIDNMSITSLKKVVAVMTGMAKRIYDAHWHPTTTFLMVSVFFWTNAIFDYLAQKSCNSFTPTTANMARHSSKRCPLWYFFRKKECIISLLSSNWRKLNVKI